jgi:hypothetical protein
MGRVARYKKVKSFDKNAMRNTGGGEYIWGESNTATVGGGRGLQKKRKQSLAAQRHQKKKMTSRQRKRNKGNLDDDDFDDFDNNGFNLAPSGKDDFDLADMNLTVKREKRVDPSTLLLDDKQSTMPTVKSTKRTDPQSVLPGGGEVQITNTKVKVGNQTLPVTIPKTDAEERRMNRMLRLNDTSKDDKFKLEGRKEGESMNAFKKRLKLETKMALMQDKQAAKRKANEEKNRNDTGEVVVSKAQRRKDFLKAKKEKKRRGRNGGNDQNYDLEENTAETTSGGGDDESTELKKSSTSSFITGEQAVAMTARTTPAAPVGSFLDQVDQPPEFKLLPRGAQKLKLKMRSSKVETSNSGGDKNVMSEDKIRAEQNAMDAMRRKVQAQYSLVKARRKKDGDFHL